MTPTPKNWTLECKIGHKGESKITTEKLDIIYLCSHTRMLIMEELALPSRFLIENILEILMN